MWFFVWLACTPDPMATDDPASPDPTGDTAATIASTADTAPRFPTGETGETGVAPLPTAAVTLGNPAQLTFPGPGTTHHHATAAYGPTGRFALTWTAGTVPNTLALVRGFGEDYAPLSEAAQLNDTYPVGDKPDIGWDGSRYTTTWDGEQPAVWLRRLDADARPVGPSTTVPLDLGHANTPDLALAPDGSGAVVFNLADIPSLGEGGGMHIFQAFDADLRLTGPTAVMSISAMTTPDVDRRDDGSFVAVWTEAYDHPLIEDERYYEVHGRIYRPDGTTHSFRVDDLDSAWPSRPAIATTADRIAVVWRDKTSSRGTSDGAYGRLFDAGGEPLGPSLYLGPPGHDGDRAVLALSDDMALFFWQHTDAGVSESWLRVVDPHTGAPLTDAMAVTPLGDRFDERPSVDARFDGDRAEVLLTWESRAQGSDQYSVWARLVTVELSR